MFTLSLLSYWEGGAAGYAGGARKSPQENSKAACLNINKSCKSRTLGAYLVLDLELALDLPLNIRVQQRLGFQWPKIGQ